MGSLGIDTLCSEYPDMSLEEAATAYARENGFIVVMKYMSSENATEYTDIAACLIDDEITAYMTSPYCFNPIVIYDARRGIEDEPPKKKTILWKKWIKVVKSKDIVSLHQLERKFGLTIMWNDQWALQTGALSQIAGLKYFNVYGPGEDHKDDMRSVVAKSYKQVLHNGKISLFKSHRPEFRDGEQTRDFVYVEDAVAATLFFYDHPEISGLFNCGTGQARTWIDLAKALFVATGVPPSIEFIDMPEQIREKYQYHTQADVAKLCATGYTKPFVSIEEGIRRYVVDYLAPQARASTESS